MDADQLADTTMDPRTRMLRRIRMEDAEQASHIFSLLMGDDVPPRKAFIVENADDFDRSKIDTRDCMAIAIGGSCFTSETSFSCIHDNAKTSVDSARYKIPFGR